MKIVQTAHQERREIVREVCLAWMQVCPWQAKEFQRYVKEITAAQYKKSGAWRKKEGGYYSHSLPADLWHSMRTVLPDFGNDDKDIKILIDEFPDMFKSNKFSITK